MTNRDLTFAALKKSILPHLQELGFEGQYPHFRRKNQDFFELISFAANPRGGSFSVGISVAFPARKHTNLIWWDGNPGSLTVFSTDKRYSLPGMFGGVFFYSDVYAKTVKRNWLVSNTCYEGVLAREKAISLEREGYHCVRHFDTNTPEEICHLLFTQLDGAFRWMRKLEKHQR